jgi:hypothetical protein
MAQKNKQKQSDPPPEISAEDREFEAEIIRRNPDRRRIMRFDFPAEVSEARAVYMFEMKAKDELAAADMADANMTDAERKSMQRSIEAERREGIRLSICGLILVDEATGNLTRMHVDQAKPLMMIDDWSIKAWAALRTFFGDLNGLPVEELGNAVRGARRLSAATAHAPQPRAATATPSGG